MQSVQLNKKIKGINDAYKRQSIALCTAESDIDGDHDLLPRIGDDYQAEIPSLHLKNEYFDHAGKWKDEQEIQDPQSTLLIVKMDVNSVSPCYLDAMPSQDERLTEIKDEHWSDVERDSFLLSLYMFGKDFALLKRIVESKTMGCIQFFYYGKFYRSHEHSRWSKLRKFSRDRVLGKRIFNRCRRQMLLSRLCSRVSKECKDSLLEISKIFEDGKISFEEYIFGLKDAVGINLLIEAVGIGKGKQDLTGTALERIKTKNVFSARPKIPVGQACSYLSSAEIIKFLTGDFRLSKARAGDIFWEAVWPRLLARGWNSEQPEESILYSQKNYLVFLMPGVEKFTKKLVKGKHYFDSVSDVLNKVASEPGLLELKVEEDKGNENSHRRNWGQPVKQDKDDVSNEQDNCHLQPCLLDCNQKPVKFTVVDTTSVDKEGQHEVGKLRCLPAKMAAGFTSLKVSSDTDYSAENSEDEAKGANAPGPSPAKLTVDGVANHVIGIINNNECHTSDHNKSVKDDCRTLNASVLNDKQPIGYMNCISRENAKSKMPNHLAPENFISEELDVGKPELLQLTNSKVPFMSQGHGINEQTKANMVHNDDDLKLSDQQPTLNNWRHSTRNRLLTVKAWEALEYGFLDSKGKRKGGDAYTGTSTSNRCRRIKRRTGSQACFNIGARKDSVNGKNLDGVSGNEACIAGKHQI